MKMSAILLKHKIPLTIAAVVLIFFASFFGAKGLFKPLLYIVFTIVSGAIVFILSYARSPIDISPVFFLMMIISLKYGFFYAVLFVIIASLVPDLFAGGEVTPGTFLFMGSFIILAFLARMFSGYGIVPLGIGLTLINLVVAFFVQFAEDNPGGFIFSIVHAGVTIFYFVALGGFLMNLVG